jgi:hypothetical protein
MPIQLSDAALIANNEVIGIIPNSLKYTEGFGEQEVRTISTGGGNVEQLYARNVETSFSKLNFELPGIVDNIVLARRWKANQNRNVFQIVGTTGDGENITRTFTQAAVTNDYEVEIGSDTSIAIEVMANASI